MSDFFPYGTSQFFDDDGNPVASGIVRVYTEDTSNVLNTITLDSAGRGAIWLGSVERNKLTLERSTGEQIWTIDNVDGQPNPSTVTEGSSTFAEDSGAANAYVATLTPAITSYATGLTVRIRIKNTNTGASTLNLNSVGVRTIRKRGSLALVAGDLVAGSIYNFVYDGAYFQLLMQDYSNTINAVCISMNQNQAIPNNTTTYLTGFATEEYDLGGFHSSGDPTNITIPGGVNVVGGYLYSIILSNNGGVGYYKDLTFNVQKNGVVYQKIHPDYADAPGQVQATIYVNEKIGPIPVEAADKISFTVSAKTIGYTNAVLIGPLSGIGKEDGEIVLKTLRYK